MHLNRGCDCLPICVYFSNANLPSSPLQKFLITWMRRGTSWHCQGKQQSAAQWRRDYHLQSNVSRVSSSDLNVDSVCEGDAKIWLIFDNVLRCNYGIFYAIINSLSLSSLFLSLSLFQVSGCISLCRGDVFHFKQGYACARRICQVQLAPTGPRSIEQFHFSYSKLHLDYILTPQVPQRLTWPQWNKPIPPSGLHKRYDWWFIYRKQKSMIARKQAYIHVNPLQVVNVLLGGC